MLDFKRICIIILIYKIFRYTDNKTNFFERGGTN